MAGLAEKISSYHMHGK